MSRQTCQTCQRPLVVCYCNSLEKVTNQIKVLIIQHPLEKDHPFNTGRIAHLCLANSELIIAETFSNAELDTILKLRSQLLYPSLSWLPDTTNPKKSDFIDFKQGDKKTDIQQLIVLDASWRKSKKMLHLNPQLQTLSRLSLTGNLKSNYQIRKSSMLDSLSTIESIVQAMTILEPKNDFMCMLKPFEKMVELQQSIYKM